MQSLADIESNFLRLVKLFHAHKDAGDQQWSAIEARLSTLEKAIGVHAPEEK